MKTTDLTIPDPPCSLFSSAQAEKLNGTAPETRFWIMLESTQPPGAKALEDSDLSDTVKSHLAACIKQIPGSRFQLLRQKSDRSTPSLFLALTTVSTNWLCEIPLRSYADIPHLPLVEFARDTPPTNAHLRPGPLLLVCTNGKRDACCSRAGLPFFNALHPLDPQNVYQTSHLGGHRFAPTVLAIPSGLYFGRMQVEQAGRFYSELVGGKIPLENLRGRCAYPAPAQAAEYFLRQITLDANQSAYRLLQVTAKAEIVWTIQFREVGTRRIHTIELAGEMSDFSVIESCSKPLERHPQIQFRLVKHSVSMVSQH